MDSREPEFSLSRMSACGALLGSFLVREILAWREGAMTPPFTIMMAGMSVLIMLVH